MDRLLVYSIVIFFLVAGINHFIMPQFYLDLIPPYIPFHSAINTLSGIAEIGISLFFFIPAFRRIGGLLAIALLIAFIPAHVYFIELGSCVTGGLCVPEWIGWLRLIVIHPLLIWWCWRTSRIGSF